MMSNIDASERVKDKLDAIMDEFEATVCDSLKQSGDTPETCQRMYILNSLLKLRHCVNGIEYEDMKEQKEA